MGEIEHVGAERMQVMKFDYLYHFPGPFCEEDGGNGGGDSTQTEPPKKTFDEVLQDKEYQAEFDRRIQKGINTALAKEREHLEALYNDKLTEQERLAKMNEEEKANFARQKREDELSKREAEINLRELKAEAKGMLSDKNLPMAFADHLNYSNADTLKASIDAFGDMWQKEIQNGVDERLKSVDTSLKDSRTEGVDEEIDPIQAKINKYKRKG